MSVAGRMMLKRVMGKASFATLQDATSRIQLYVTRDAIGEEAYADFKKMDLGDILGAEGTLMKTKTGELSVKVDEAAPADQEPASAARQVPRHGRPGAEVSPALRRPDHRRSRPHALRRPQPRRQRPARIHGRQRLPRSRDADAAPHPRRRQCQALQDAPQRARPGDVPAHRARAVPEAPDRRRLRARVRDQPELPQRRHLGAAQPRVHDDGVLRGLLELPGPDGLHRDDHPHDREEDGRHGAAHVPGQGRGPEPALRAPDDPRSHPQAHRCGRECRRHDLAHQRAAQDRPERREGQAVATQPGLACR